MLNFAGIATWRPPNIGQQGMRYFQAMYHSRRRKPSNQLRQWTHLRAWLWRYLPAEAAELILALLCGTLATTLTEAEPIRAAASAWSATIGYYGVLFAAELLDQLRARDGGRARVWCAVGSSLRSLVRTFGGAEALDSLLCSPILTYLCVQSLPNRQLAIVVSEAVSTALFYSIVTIRARAGRNHYTPHPPPSTRATTLPATV